MAPPNEVPATAVATGGPYADWTWAGAGAICEPPTLAEERVTSYCVSRFANRAGTPPPSLVGSSPATSTSMTSPESENRTTLPPHVEQRRDSSEAVFRHLRHIADTTSSSGHCIGGPRPASEGSHTE